MANEKHNPQPWMRKAADAATENLINRVPDVHAIYLEAIRKQILDAIASHAPAGGETPKDVELGIAAMRALESLTPSGSEYVNDPKRCADYIRNARHSTLEAAEKMAYTLDDLLSAKCTFNEIRNALIARLAAYNKAVEGQKS